MATGDDGFNVLDFFDLSKKKPEIIIPGGHARIVPSAKADVFNPTAVRQSREQERNIRGKIKYDSIQNQMKSDTSLRLSESSDAFSGIEDYASRSGPSRMSDIDTIVPSTLATLPNLEDVSTDLTSVYSTYNFAHRIDKKLPIFMEKQKILSSVNGNAVTIIHGETGCGKSTQVPQYILDEAYEHRKSCNIIITQPRRIAAMALAKRVSEERGWSFPSIVGYHIGMDNKTTPDTRITYCTTGVLLMKLVTKKNFDNYTHIILDEVHERDQDMDFTMIVLKLLLEQTLNSVKVILMSATFDVGLFSQYFIKPDGNITEPPIIDLEKSERIGYLISTYYLDQFTRPLGIDPDVIEHDPRIDTESYKIAKKLIMEFDKLESQDMRGNIKRGAVLVFLPGINEIEEMYSMMKDQENLLKWQIRPLHSTITLEEQHLVFQKAPQGYRKIILSTNIAESSITVPDIIYVIDFCRTKHLVCDPVTNYTSLQLMWASKANCIQRAGRAGRVCEGRVYRLVPSKFFTDVLRSETLPEMKRAPLSSCVLKSKLLNLGEPSLILSMALDPPDITNIENTVLSLKEVGALFLETNAPVNYFDGDITYFGRVMSKLPFDIRVSRMIIIGHMFSVLEESIIMAAALSLKSMFSSPFQGKIKAYNSKLTWADGSCSDLLACLNAYIVWCNNHRDGYFMRSRGNTEKQWALRHFIQLQVLKEMKYLVEDIKKRLKTCGINEIPQNVRITWSDIEKPLILKVVIAGAFYPNYFVYNGGGQDFELTAVKQVGGHDPFNTVYFQNFPTNQPGELYVGHFKEYLKECSENMIVSFDGTSKAYVKFPRVNEVHDKELQYSPSISGKIPNAVYRAVKLRKCDERLSIKVLHPAEAKRRAEELAKLRENENPFYSLSTGVDDLIKNMRPRLPTISSISVGIQVCHVVDPNHFWAQDTGYRNEIAHIDNALNTAEYSSFTTLKSYPTIGKIYIAPFTDKGETRYYRARVESLLYNRTKAHVYYIDYGNSEIINTHELYEFECEEDQKVLYGYPPAAFECVLSELKPSLLKNPKGMWSRESINIFTKLVYGQVFSARVYSVVQGIVSLELFPYERSGQLSKISINQWLRDNKYAESSEESYLSKVDHDLRMQYQSSGMDDSDIQYSGLDNHLDPWTHLHPDIEPPRAAECLKQSVTLRGPVSPLEINVNGLTLICQERSLSIESPSINSVLLDSDPQDMHQRMLVAVEVIENEDKNTMILRQTTLMPNIHGFSALMAMLFCPVMELRANPAYTKVTGTLCGLGVDPFNYSKTPLYPEHDMEVRFDVQFTLEDFEEINKLRFWMNTFASCGPQEDLEEAVLSMDVQVVKCQQKIKDFIMRLLTRPRKSLEFAQKDAHFMWNLLAEDRLICPLEENAVLENQIFQLHWAVDLDPENEEDIDKKIKHLNELKTLVNSGRMKEAKCELCETIVTSAQQLRLHLASAYHKEHEQSLKQQAIKR